MNNPMWSTPERKACLADMLSQYLPIAGWKVDLLTGEVYNPEYEARIAPLIEYWKAQDREADTLEWRIEQRALHSLGETSQPIRGRFNNIGRDIFHTNQPVYYLEGLGLDCIRLTPFAKIKIASSYMRLYVNLGDSLRGVSKHRRRKAIRYSKPLPQEAQVTISELVKLAVRDYLK